MKNSIIYITLCFGILTSCSNQEKQDITESLQATGHNSIDLTAEQFKTIGIGLGKIEQKNLHSVVKASGYLALPPQKKASVSSFMGAIVKNINVAEGILVKQGQTLAILEHPDFIKLQEEYIAAKNNLDFLEKEYQRQQELSEHNAGTGKVFQKTQADYNTGKAKLSSLENQLKLLSVNLTELSKGNIIPSFALTAPIDGYIGHINAGIGEFTEPNKILFIITDNSQIHVDLLVYEKDLFKVKIGQKVNFVLANQPDHQAEHNHESIEGQVFGVNKSFENDTKALTIHASIENEHHELIPGMYVNALIDVGSQTVNAVPVDAIIKSEGKEWIFIVDESQSKPDHYFFKMEEVVTGISELGAIEITPLNKIPNDARVVIKNAFFILSKAKGGGEED